MTVLASLLVGIAMRQPSQEPLAHAPICADDATARRGAILAAITSEIDAVASRGDAERARREELARRVEPLRTRVQAIFDEIVEHARASVAGARSAAPSGAVDRLRSVHLRWIEPSDPSLQDDRALRRGCGSDLLADEAWVDKTGSYIVLCPGLLLVAEAEGSLRAGLAFLIAHELGHVIVGPRATSEHAERVAESEADRWGGRVLRSMSHRRSATATGDFLRATLEPICAPKADATHASGPDRVRTVLRELAS